MPNTCALHVIPKILHSTLHILQPKAHTRFRPHPRFIPPQHLLPCSLRPGPTHDPPRLKPAAVQPAVSKSSAPAVAPTAPQSPGAQQRAPTAVDYNPLPWSDSARGGKPRSAKTRTTTTVNADILWNSEFPNCGTTLPLSRTRMTYSSWPARFAPS